jgi:hypothetical protein
MPPKLAAAAAAPALPLLRAGSRSALKRLNACSIRSNTRVLTSTEGAMNCLQQHVVQHG